jgi:hypothetical protein
VFQTFKFTKRTTRHVAIWAVLVPAGIYYLNDKYNVSSALPSPLRMRFLCASPSLRGASQRVLTVLTLASIRRSRQEEGRITTNQHPPRIPRNRRGIVSVRHCLYSYETIKTTRRPLLAYLATPGFLRPQGGVTNGLPHRRKATVSVLCSAYSRHANAVCEC